MMFLSMRWTRRLHTIRTHCGLPVIRTDSFVDESDEATVTRVDALAFAVGQLLDDAVDDALVVDDALLEADEALHLKDLLAR